uniref:EF-hand domain-containing protein n=1 Tax=Magallana gigas TaxID=29159 RepID=A0A8W8NR95_MAGGI|nr:uncharacterized protein LOC117687161 [Crassostrea gigas]
MANLNKREHKASDNHQTTFFEAEFNAWDKQNRGYLTMEEYVNLFEFLQYGDRSKIIELLGSIIQGRDRSKNITMELHMDVMSRPGVKERTSRHRDFFMTFADGSDTATRKQILQRYEQIMGDQFTEEHKEKIYNLKIGFDGKVTYEDFFRNYLLERGQAGASRCNMCEKK